MNNNIIDFNDIKNIKKPTELTVIDDKSHELSIPKTTALAIRKQVSNVMEYNKHLNLELWIINEFIRLWINIPQEKIDNLIKEHNQADDYKEQKAA